jgi:hypothetical protein
MFSLSFLPHNLPLASLELSALEVQLRPQGGWVGMLRPGVPLKKLRLTHCTLLDGAAGLAAALSLLSGLEHLSIETDCDMACNKEAGAFPPSVLSAVEQLQQLTYLKLDCCVEGASSQEGSTLQPLGSLTRLLQLHLAVRVTEDSPTLAYVDDSVLSSLQHLTCLELQGNIAMSSNSLARMSQLQHLDLSGYVRGAEAGFAELLSGLQHLTQLTALALCSCDMDTEVPYPMSAAFSALTASSTLRNLDVSECLLPEGVWEHVFPTGRKLPHLTSMDISHPKDLHEDAENASEDSPEDSEDPYDDPVEAPDAERLVSCCPGLLSLNMLGLKCSTESLTPLQGLSALQQLYLHIETWRRVEELSGLINLRHLEIFVDEDQWIEKGLPLQLTELQQLTYLDFGYTHCEDDRFAELHRVLVCKVSAPAALANHVVVMHLHVEVVHLHIMLIVNGHVKHGGCTECLNHVRPLSAPTCWHPMHAY